MGMRDGDIDSLSADGAQEPYQLRRYRVDVQSDRWDSDSVRYHLEVTASGPNDARNQALLDFPGGRVRHIEQIGESGVASKPDTTDAAGNGLPVLPDAGAPLDG